MAKFYGDPAEFMLQAIKSAGDWQKVSRELKTIYLVWILQCEVENGGWLQWVANSSGAFANETLDALRDLGRK